jgi:replicative DNA helicase
MAFHIAENLQWQIDKTTGQPRKDLKPKSGGVVAFFSLEMSAEQLAGRILAESSNIASEKLRTGRIEQHEFDRLVASADHLRKIPLYIDDTPAISVTTLRSRARRLKRQHGLHLIVVDYLQLMRPSAGFKSDSRVNEVSEITRSLKAIAKELNVPLIALSQLSRAVESRDDKRPQLSDLRESGSIEQDADAVMFVYRAEYYVGREEPVMSGDDVKYQQDYQKWQEKLAVVKNKAEIIIAKQRHGPIGKVELHFDGATTRFSNLAHPDQLPKH